MDDNGNISGGWGRIIGGIVLIIVLFVCIKLVFWGLDQIIPKRQADLPSGASVSQAVTEDPDAPSFCVHCGRALPESFRWGQFCPYCGEKNER